MNEENGKVPITVIIPTLNEEVNLVGCLESVCDWADEIVVIDAGSDDKTIAIAEEYAAKVYAHHFGRHKYATQKNWALTELPLSHSWVLLLDADERVTHELQVSIAKVLSRPIEDCTSGFTISIRLIFLGRSIKHGAYAPNWALRLFHREKVRYVDVGGLEYAQADELTQPISGLIIHHDSKDLAAWTNKQNDRSTLEAYAMLSRENNGVTHEKKKRQRIERRGHAKAGMWTRLPLILRAFLLFFYGYVIRLGFLDGREGFVYSFLMSFWYRVLVDAKYLELRSAHTKSSPRTGLPRES